MSAQIQTTVSACVADEARIAEAIKNTSRRREAIAATLPELESKFQRARESYESNVAQNIKAAVFPRAEREAVGAAAAEIASLDSVLRELKAKLDAARKATKLAEMKALEARENADLLALCEALKPALVINERLKREHDQAGSMHRSLALPWLDQGLLDGLRSFLVKGSQPAPKLPKTHVLVRFIKNWPGSLPSSAIGGTAAYNAGEVAAFPRRTAAALEGSGVVCHAPQD